jgi:urease accessory protein
MSAAAIAGGWRARLALKFEAAAGRTRLTHRLHEGPLLVQRPFYPEMAVPGAIEPCHLYIIHPPGGVASGDDLALEVAVAPGAHALLTTPAAGKFYRRGPAGAARVVQHFNVAGGALEWLPQENIYYPDALVQLRNVVRLSGDARYIGWEIGALGLPASARRLEGGSLRLGLELWRDERPLLLERLALSAAVQSARWGLSGHSALGTALAYPADAATLEHARASLAADARANCAGITIACTLVDQVLICRALARRADQLREAFVCWWGAVRPAVLGRAAVAPRIWKT